MFIDTNILVSARIPAAPDHERAAASLDRAKEYGEGMAVSRQIMREFLSVVTRPQIWAEARRPISMRQALAEVRWMTEAFGILEDGEEVSERLFHLCQNYPVGGRQIHDANIVATMLAYGERRLLTFNAADFRRYGDLIELAEA